MSRMSELSIEIQDMLMAGMSNEFIAKSLKIPVHWVTEISEEDAYIAYMEERAAQEFAAEQYADEDAISYGAM